MNGQTPLQALLITAYRNNIPDSASTCFNTAGQNTDESLVQNKVNQDWANGPFNLR